MNIFFFIGTKAQAIKCLPLIQSLLNSNKSTLFIVDSGQHVELVDDILSETNLNLKRIKLYKNKSNISTFSASFEWLINFFFRYIFKSKSEFKNMDNKLCILHGDTLSTLLGLIWAKKNNFKILHLESGLTSKNLLFPFPEEIIRRVVSRFSDILICFDSDSFKHLEKRFHNSKIIKRVSENTIIETFKLENSESSQNIITVTLHRTENIISKKKLINFLNLLNSLPKSFTINWYLHEPTKYYLTKFKVTVPRNINLCNLLPHKKFINEIKKSKIIITDGGSIQEECYFLGKKTLIWRKNTERGYALNKNMFISKYNLENSINFIKNKNLENSNIAKLDSKPSLEIVNIIDTLDLQK